MSLKSKVNYLLPFQLRNGAAFTVTALFEGDLITTMVFKDFNLNAETGSRLNLSGGYI